MYILGNFLNSSSSADFIKLQKLWNICFVNLQVSRGFCCTSQRVKSTVKTIFLCKLQYFDVKSARNAATKPHLNVARFPLQPAGTCIIRSCMNSNRWIFGYNCSHSVHMAYISD